MAEKGRNDGHQLQTPLNGAVSFQGSVTPDNDSSYGSQSQNRVLGPPKRRVYTDLTTAYTVITSDSASNSSKTNLHANGHLRCDHFAEMTPRPLRLANKDPPTPPPIIPLPPLPAPAYLQTSSGMQSRSLGNSEHNRNDASGCGVASHGKTKLSKEIQASDPSTAPRFANLRDIFRSKSSRSHSKVKTTNAIGQPYLQHRDSSHGFRFDGSQDHFVVQDPEATSSTESAQNIRRDYSHVRKGSPERLRSSRGKIFHKQSTDQDIFGSQRDMQADTYDIKNLHRGLGLQDRPVYQRIHQPLGDEDLVKDESTVSHIVSHYEEEYDSGSDHESVLNRLSLVQDNTHTVTMHLEPKCNNSGGEMNYQYHAPDRNFGSLDIDENNYREVSPVMEARMAGITFNAGDDIFFDISHRRGRGQRYQPGSAPKIALPTLPPSHNREHKRNACVIVQSESYGNTSNLLCLNDALQLASADGSLDDPCAPAHHTNDTCAATTSIEAIVSDNQRVKQANKPASYCVYEASAEFKSSDENGLQDAHHLLRDAAAHQRHSGITVSESSPIIADECRSLRVASDTSDLVDRWRPIIQMPGGIHAAAGLDDSFYDEQAVIASAGIANQQSRSLTPVLCVGIERPTYLRVQIERRGDGSLPAKQTSSRSKSDEGHDEEQANDWVTVQSAQDSLAPEIVPWSRIGEETGSSVADYSLDDDVSSLQESHYGAIPHMHSREKILQHPAPVGYNAVLRERQIQGRGLLGVNHPVLLPSYAPHRVNGGLFSNSARTAALQPYFREAHSHLHPSQFQSSCNPFTSTPPDISKGWSTTDPSTSMSGQPLATSSEFSNASEAEDLRRTRKASVSSEQAASQVLPNTFYSPSNGLVTGDYAAFLASSPSPVPERRQCMYNTLARTHGHVDLTMHDQNHNPDPTQCKAHVQESYYSRPSTVQPYRLSMLDSKVQCNQHIDESASPKHMYIDLNHHSPSVTQRKAALTPERRRTVIQGRRLIPLRLASGSGKPATNHNQTGGSVQEDLQPQSTGYGDLLCSRDITQDSVDTGLRSSTPPGPDGNHPRRQYKRVLSDAFQMRSPTAPMSKTWAGLYTKDQRIEHERRRQERIATDIEAAGGLEFYKGGSTVMIEGRPRLIPTLHPGEKDMEHRATLLNRWLLALCIVLPPLAVIHWLGGFDSALHNLTHGQVSEVEGKRVALWWGIFGCTVIVVMIAVFVPLGISRSHQGS